jgi:protein tyrosine phosphatase
MLVNDNVFNDHHSIVSSPDEWEHIRVLPNEWKAPIVLRDFAHISSSRDIQFEYRILRVLTENSKMAARLYYHRSITSPPVSPRSINEGFSVSRRDRYRNIVPFGENRVLLSGGGYINASYMPNLSGSNKKAFIACQGPLSNTIADQWEMIWTENVKVVFAIGRLYEGSTEKCAQYWPSSDTDRHMRVQYKPESVVHTPTSEYDLDLVREDAVCDGQLIRREIRVSSGDSSRIVIHYHFLAWPDHTAIKSSSTLLNLVTRMHMFRSQYPNHPVVIHCSAGVGRTGCALTMCHVIESLEDSIRRSPHLENEGISILSIAINLRRYRLYMMQTTDQYVSVFETTSFLLQEYLSKHQQHQSSSSVLPHMPIEELRYC